MSETQGKPQIATAPAQATPGSAERVIIGVLTLVGAFAGIGLLAFVKMEGQALALVAGLVGMLAGNASTVVNYVFGSSAGSGAKDGVISRLLTR